jgi:hypothetical protein
MIHELFVSAGPSDTEAAALKSLEYPRLRRLWLIGGVDDADANADHGGTAVALGERVLQLRELFVPRCNGSEDAGARDLRALARSNVSTLRVVQLSGTVLSAQDLVILASLPQLASLSLGGVAAVQHVWPCDERLPTPFTRFRRLIATVTLSAVVPPLLDILEVRTFTSLELRLGLPLVSRVTLPAIAMLTSLGSLRLRLPRVLELRRTDLLALCRLAQLRALEIDSSRSCGALAFCNAGDGDLVALVAAMPCLRLIYFLARTFLLTPAALTGLAPPCPALQHLIVSGAFAFEPLPLAGPPLFPALKKLQLGA